MEAPIPPEWLQPVLRILRDGQFGREIEYPKSVWNRWDDDTFGEEQQRENDSLTNVERQSSPKLSSPAIQRMWVYY